MNKDFFDIRYIELTFTLRMMQSGKLPKDKTSALRGGIGDILLTKHCVGNRECENCSFEKECIVRRVMYAKYEVRPEFVTNGESIGYIFFCPDEREECRQNDELNFRLKLFGKCISHLGMYIDALQSLGRSGLGRNHIPFVLTEVKDQEQNIVFENNRRSFEKMKINTLREYIEFRKQAVSEESREFTLRFETPLSLKHNGTVMENIDADVLYRAVCRRIYMLSCFEGIECDIFSPEAKAPFEVFVQDVIPQGIKRYSSHKNQKISLNGICGNAEFRMADDADVDTIIKLLIAGEITHIGKSTGFGFGKYCMKSILEDKENV